MQSFRQPYPNELYHYGTLGMKWGIRRYQNSDGTLTEAGARRYSDTTSSASKTVNQRNFKTNKNSVKNDMSSHSKHKSSRYWDIGESPVIKNYMTGGYTDTYAGRLYDDDGNLIGHVEPTAELDEDGHFYVPNVQYKSLSERLVEKGQATVDKYKRKQTKPKGNTSSYAKKLTLQEERISGKS